VPLGLEVLLVVLAVTVIFAVFGYLIDKSAKREERKEGR
jgi:preprotein translocase subunit SecE